MPGDVVSFIRMDFDDHTSGAQDFGENPEWLKQPSYFVLQDVQSISTLGWVERAGFVEKMLAIQAYIYCTTYEKSRIRLLTSTTCSHDVGKSEVTC